MDQGDLMAKGDVMSPRNVIAQGDVPALKM
jgi:hypothetical protein